MCIRDRPPFRFEFPEHLAILRPHGIQVLVVEIGPEYQHEISVRGQVPNCPAAIGCTGEIKLPEGLDRSLLSQALSKQEEEEEEGAQDETGSGTDQRIAKSPRPLSANSAVILSD